MFQFGEVWLRDGEWHRVFLNFSWDKANDSVKEERRGEERRGEENRREERRGEEKGLDVGTQGKAVCGRLVNSRRDRGMEEWSYQQRSDEGLGSGQDKHKPAQKELQHPTHTHTHKHTHTRTCTHVHTCMNFTHTYMDKCTNIQTLKAAGALYSSRTHTEHTHTHLQTNKQCTVWLPDHNFLSVKLCDNSLSCHLDISFHHILHISPFAQIPQSKHTAKRVELAAVWMLNMWNKQSQE